MLTVWNSAGLTVIVRIKYIVDVSLTEDFMFATAVSIHFPESPAPHPIEPSLTPFPIKERNTLGHDRTRHCHLLHVRINLASTLSIPPRQDHGPISRRLHPCQQQQYQQAHQINKQLLQIFEIADWPSQQFPNE
tara:strand:- start:1260 stop:1661 length:402 start_codon:yes stop_codon:yes gene_type:complete